MGYLLLALWLTLLPICVGSLFSYQNTVQAPLRLLQGQFLLWALFQLVTVPIVIAEGTLEHVMAVYIPLSVILGLAGLVCLLKRKERPALQSAFLGDAFAQTTREKNETAVLLILVLALWLFQMYIVLTQAVYDGDDSFYMAVANLANTNGSLYQINPYSMGTMGLNYRYILAPFPVWVAMLARMSGLHTLTVGHVALGVFLISLSYLIYWQIGSGLFKEKMNRLRFMLCVCVLYIWGNTSIHTAESFLITRSRQGKALVSGLAFPAFVSILISMGSSLDAGKTPKASSYIYISCVMLTGCLGSAFGGAILLLFWGIINLMWAVSYRKIRQLPGAVCAALPSAAFSLIYLLSCLAD
ncbi:MAG: DUF6077 domain-containing protein [Lachnospiraceae bacterium]|nr:DUF6077 domain-containing protein [Lachnospiraceae bacterium]